MQSHIIVSSMHLLTQVKFSWRRKIRYSPNAMYESIWEALLELYNRVDGADSTLTHRLSDPVSRPDAAEGGTRVRHT
jgi:hypothetical protein